MSFLRFFILFLALSAATAKAGGPELLSNCSVQEDEASDLQDKIETSAEVVGWKKETHATAENPFPDANLVYDFAQEIWFQGMKNLLVTRLDAEMRYAGGKTPDVNAVFEELCSRDASGPSQRNECLLESKITPAEVTKLIAVGKRYVLDFRASGLHAFTATALANEMNVRVEKIAVAEKAVNAVLNEFPATSTVKSESSAVRDATFTTSPPFDLNVAKKTKWPKRLAQARKALIAEKIRQSTSGPGILFYTHALQPYARGVPIPGSAPIVRAVSELKEGILIEAGRLNVEVGFATGFGAGKQLSSRAWLDKLISGHPVAVGQLVAKNPKYAASICSFLGQIAARNTLMKREEMGLQVAVIASAVVGSLAVTPELIGLELSEKAISRILMVKALRFAVEDAAFGGIAADDVGSHSELKSKTEEIRRSILQKSGSTEEDLLSTEKDLRNNRNDIGYDVLYLVIPNIVQATAREGHEVEEASRFLDPTTAGKTARFFAKISNQKRTKAAFQIFCLICGSLNDNCGVVMAAFIEVPGASSEEKFMRQKRILSDQAHRDAFIEKTLAEKATHTR